VPELSVNCNCRKPGFFFLEEAKRKYSLDMSLCWMVGDRDSDIICGAKAGVRTVLILNQEELKTKKTEEISPDFKVKNLMEAVDIIIKKL
jgi:D-glycero-D-manno-heptose 1,7-bisphosphate phosphatase